MMDKQARRVAIADLGDDIYHIRMAAKIADKRSPKLAEKMRQEADEWQDQYNEMAAQYLEDYGESFLEFPEQK